MEGSSPIINASTKGQRHVDGGCVGQDLGVQHVLKGSIRAAGGKVRISAQLIEAATGQSIWAERYDRVLDDVFALQDEITQTIVATLVGRLEHAASVRAKQAGATTTSVYDYILRGKRCLGEYSEEEILKARAMFEQALELDPNYARTYVELSDTYYIELISPWSKAPDIAAERVFEYARKAVALDDLDSQAHAALGRAYYRVKANYELAEAQFETAIALNPNDVWNYCSKGFFLTCSGRLEEGISCDTYALRLNPLLPDPCLYSIGLAHYLGRRYEDAIATFAKMSYLPMEILGCFAASYAQLGREGEARATATECRDRAVVEFTTGLEDDVERWRAYWLRFIPLKGVTDRDHLFDGLRKAGLPA
jgi:adenylate cyclase